MTSRVEYRKLGESKETHCIADDIATTMQERKELKKRMPLVRSFQVAEYLNGYSILSKLLSVLLWWKCVSFVSNNHFAASSKLLRYIPHFFVCKSGFFPSFLNSFPGIPTSCSSIRTVSPPPPPLTPSVEKVWLTRCFCLFFFPSSSSSSSYTSFSLSLSPFSATVFLMRNR